LEIPAGSYCCLVAPSGLGKYPNTVSGE